MKNIIVYGKDVDRSGLSYPAKRSKRSMDIEYLKTVLDRRHKTIEWMQAVFGDP